MKSISSLDRGYNAATMAVALSNVWNRDDFVEPLSQNVVDTIEDLFEGVAEEYRTIAEYELGDLWDLSSWVNSDDSADVLAQAILGIVDSGYAEEYVENQDLVVRMVREFVSHA